VSVSIDDGSMIWVETELLVIQSYLETWSILSIGYKNL